MTERKLNLPIDNEGAIKDVHVGDWLFLNGILYVARDAAHQRIAETLAMGSPLPMPIENQAIYYMGPAPAKPGQVIGSAGPTTSARMDKYTPQLLDLGLKVMIGKGDRSEAVVKSMIKNGGVYLAAIGGAAAYYAQCIVNREVVAYEDLGAEAILKITVQNFPVIVAIDSSGKSIYKKEHNLRGKNESDGN